MKWIDKWMGSEVEFFLGDEVIHGTLMELNFSYTPATKSTRVDIVVNNRKFLNMKLERIRHYDRIMEAN
jgi:hypothetical protein